MATANTANQLGNLVENGGVYVHRRSVDNSWTSGHGQRDNYNYSVFLVTATGTEGRV